MARKLNMDMGRFALRRVKVILAFKPDLACVTYPAKSYKDWTWSYPGRFDRLASC
jgi:hypothetical protein